jgi:hypothetical protein
MTKPIKANVHCAIDYAQAISYSAAPFVFGVKGAMRLLGPAIGGGALVLAAITRNRFAIRPTISYRTHGNIDYVFLPTIPLLAALGGAFNDPRQRRILAASLAVTGPLVLLSDFDAN